MPAPSLLATQLLELQLISEYFGNASAYIDESAEYPLPDTPVRRKLLKAYNEIFARSVNQEPEALRRHEGVIWTNAMGLLLYLGARASAFRERLDQHMPTPVSRGELEVFAEMLEFLSKNFNGGYPSERGEENCYLPNTPEGRVLAEAVIRHKGGAKVEATVRKVLASKDGPELFDTWVLAYLSDRYAKLATIAPEKGIGFTEKDLPIDLYGEQKNESTSSDARGSGADEIVSPRIARSWLKDCKSLLKNEIATRDNPQQREFDPNEFINYANNIPPRTSPFTVAQYHRKVASSLNRWAMRRSYLTQDACIREQQFDARRWVLLFSACYESYLRTLDLIVCDNFRSFGTITFIDFWTAALGFVLGQRERAERLAHVFIIGYRLRWVSNFDYPHDAPCVCALRIMADHLGEPDLPIHKNYRPHAIYDALFRQWRNPDLAVITPLLLAACDEHTWRVQGRKTVMLFDGSEFYYYGHFPVEILMIFRLREYMGLPNPVLDHPLMNTALGKLPTETVPYAYHEVIGPVVARMRREGYDDTTVLQRLRDAGERMGPRED